VQKFAPFKVTKLAQARHFFLPKGGKNVISPNTMLKKVFYVLTDVCHLMFAL